MDKTIDEVAGQADRELVTHQVEQDDHLVGRIQKHLEKLRDAVGAAEDAGLVVDVRFHVKEPRSGINFDAPMEFKAVRVRHGKVDGLAPPEAEEEEPV